MYTLDGTALTHRTEITMHWHSSALKMFGHYPKIGKFLGTCFYCSQYILLSVENSLQVVKEKDNLLYKLSVQPFHYQVICHTVYRQTVRKNGRKGDQGLGTRARVKKSHILNIY
jgi:hypothetical protein